MSPEIYKRRTERQMQVMQNQTTIAAISQQAKILVLQPRTPLYVTKKTEDFVYIHLPTTSDFNKQKSPYLIERLSNTVCFFLSNKKI
jgi:hypothetical protein